MTQEFLDHIITVNFQERDHELSEHGKILLISQELYEINGTFHKTPAFWIRRLHFFIIY